MKAALLYAKRFGWRVLPDEPGGKRPLLNDWPSEATTDPQRIAAWWERWPDANVGIATGAGSGIIVLDVDGQLGADSLARLVAQHGPLPVTTHQITGSGGSHYIFKAPSFPVTNSAGKIAPGLDIRGEGGQIVVAPSVSGKGVYRWVRPPWETPLADAPAWLLALLRRSRAQTSATDSETRGYFPLASPAVLDAAREALAQHGPAVEGRGGDEHTFKACALLIHDFALTLEEAWDVLTAWNATCAPPWELDGLRTKLHGGGKYGKHPYGCRRSMDAVEAVRKAVRDWQARGDTDPFELIKAVRELCFDDPAKHAVALKELRAATGLTAKAIGLPPPVDLAEEAARTERRKAFESGTDADLIDPTDPLGTMRRFQAASHDAEGCPEIVRHQGEYWGACGTHYEPRPDEAVNGDLYRYAEGKRNVLNGAPVKPDRSMIENLAHAFRSAVCTTVPIDPSWIRSVEGDPPPGEIITFRNGFLHVPTRAFLPASRRFFTTNGLRFRYEPHPPQPSRWFAFMDQVWGDDLEARETWQEFMGLCLTGDTSHQKIWLIIGPPRSGKGTMARILQALVGEANHAAPTLNGLGQQFGLETLIGKMLAVISDARLGARADQSAIVENLLRISGEDAISVPRKHRGDWSGKLRARFLLLSNEVPALLDPSGAMAKRFTIMRLQRSFYGNEDLGLTARLLGELPGILAWALQGLDRLRTRGYFRQPASALDIMRQLDTLGSPVRAFIEERCELQAGATVESGALFSEWQVWAQRVGREHPGTQAIFTRNLTAAFPGVRVSRPRVTNGSQVRHYEGLRIRQCVTSESRVSHADPSIHG